MPPSLDGPPQDGRFSQDGLSLNSGGTVDRYVVEELVGRGGMAVVYRVRHAQLGSRHALKVLSFRSATIQSRLLAEGRAQGSFHHPNVVAVTDVISIDGAPALVMEFVDGPSLEGLLARGPLTLAQSDALARGILRGVAAAHRHGLIHRDLKPANILLVAHDGHLVPKVADFGLVKLAREDDGQHTRTGSTMGTPAYMAPEQIRDVKRVDARADVFSLGAILYELVTGRRAFTGRDMYDIFKAIAEGPRPPLPPNVPQRMAEAINGALAADPADRIPDVTTLLDTWSGGAESLGSGPWDAEILSDFPTRDTLPPPVASAIDSAVASDLTWQATQAGTSETIDATSLPSWSGPGAGLTALTFFAGVLGSFPVLAGFIAAILGSAEHLLAMGVLLPLLLSALVVGVSGALTIHRVDHPLPWLAGPLLVVALGSALSQIDEYMLSAAISDLLQTHDLSSISHLPDRLLPADVGADWTSVLPVVLERSIDQVFATDIVGLALTGLLSLCAALVLNATRRPVCPERWRATATIATAVLGGGVLWFLQPLAMDEGATSAAALFIVYGSLVVASVSIGKMSHATPERDVDRPTWTVGMLGSLGVCCAAEAVTMQEHYALYRQGIESVLRFDRVMAVEAFATNIDWTSIAFLTAWGVLTWVVAAIPVLTVRPLRVPFSWVSLIITGLFFVSVGSTARITSMCSHQEMAGNILPVRLATAAHEHLGFMLQEVSPGDRPSWATGGHRVASAAADGPVSDGDYVLAINGQSGSIRDFIAHLNACACEGGSDCALVEGCLQPGDAVRLTVIRAPDGRLEEVEVELQSQGG